jgi:tRNA A37 threonylcarbamoyladenosine modification protein TsaB
MYLYINPTQPGQIDLKLFDRKELKSKTSLKGGVKLTEKLIEGLLKFLHKNKLSIKKVKGIILATGPGGFTSLRISCLIVNTISQLNNIPTFGASLPLLTTDRQIVAAIKKIKKGRVLLPAYDREPNITLSK